MTVQDLMERMKTLLDNLAVQWLRLQIAWEKSRLFDDLAENVQGLRRALDTQQRATDDLHRQLAERDRQIERLKAEHERASTQHKQSDVESTKAQRLRLFNALRSLAIQYPTLKNAVADGADISARDVLDLLAPFDDALRDLGFERIGEAGTEAAFDARLHKAVGRGARSVEVADPVRIRYVGYTYEDDVVSRAEVTAISKTESIS